MVKLKFCPRFFPVLLMPLYWIFWICFYLWYLPFMLVVFLFSPYRSRKSLLEYYQKKNSSRKRNMEESKEGGDKDESDLDMDPNPSAA